MARSAITKDYTIEDIATALYDAMGNVAIAARALHVHPNTIYNYLDEHPELAEAKKKAAQRRRDLRRDIARDVLEQVMDMVKLEPATAAKQAQYILSKDKDSEYYEKAAEDAKTQKTDELIDALNEHTQKRVLESEAMQSDSRIDSET